MSANGDTPESGAVLDEWKTDEFLRSLILKVGRAEQSSEAAIGEVRQLRLKVESIERRLDVIEQHLARLMKQGNANAMAMRTAAKGVQSIGESVADISAHLALLGSRQAASEQVFADKLEKLRGSVVALRDVNNANPDTPDVPEVTKVHNILAIVDTKMMASKLELKDKELAEARARRESERVRYSKAELQREERSRYWIRWVVGAVLALILLIVGALLKGR